MEKNISVIYGDGIGPEIMKETIKILNSITKKYGHNFYYHYLLAGIEAIKMTGNPIPEKTLQICSKSDAILLGCIGDPAYKCKSGYKKITPEDGLLQLRKKMKLYCNIRPVIFYPDIHRSPINRELLKNVNFVIYRELTGGIYFGEKGRNESGELAYDNCIYSKNEIERIGNLAFKASISRRKKLTLVDKSNVLETSKLWREVIIKIGLSYPEVKLDFLYIDNAAMQIILNPSRFDVILTDNMFGDILSDESSVICGSIGMLPSSSIGGKTPLFEPVHGSYPKAKGKNIANPLGCILSGSMMLEYFGMHKEKCLLEEAVKKSIENGVFTEDICYNTNPSTTEDVGNYIKKYIDNQ
ncbi:3-isopropylmalate dehydrogenase [Blattabacterium cuenoti]|uniref:3-isopropylmalate dehydrogenase n=1 Tax=Blattabacterium cuenoti TaxID=1653831 RepID=UPI00163BFBAB|nr:3-isopropylmalate dehydrogenase [Blattabacterium cuenoti]